MSRENRPDRCRIMGLVAESVLFLAGDREVVEPDRSLGFVIECGPACQFEAKHLHGAVLNRNLELGSEVLLVIGSGKALAVGDGLCIANAVDRPLNAL